MDQELKDLLIAYAEQYETAAFLDGDPSWFMHQVSGDSNCRFRAKSRYSRYTPEKAYSPGAKNGAQFSM